MKFKKYLLGAVCALGAMGSQMAQADIDISTAQIVRVGVDPRFVGAMVQVRDLTQQHFSDVRQFYLSPELGDVGYATILSALALGENVFLRVAGDGASGSLVTIIYLNNPST